jgi:hypothetical protein
MIRLKDILNEIGENTSKPYPFSPVELYVDLSTYAFETDSGITYRVYIEKERKYKSVIHKTLSLGSDIEYEVAFAAINFGEKDKALTKRGVVRPDYDVEVNDPKNLFRVMATVIDVLKKEIAKDETGKRDDETGETIRKASKVRRISMKPSKRKIKEPGSGITMDDPADDRRKNLYAAFIKKNAPEGSTVKELGKELVIELPEERPLKWTKANNISELLDPTTGDQYDLQGPKTSSFTFNDGSTEHAYVWTYKNRKGNKMDITITFETEYGGKNPKMIIAFGVANKNTLSKYGAMTGAGDLKVILKTIIGAAQQVIDKELPAEGKDGVMAVGFEPADERRERIYDYFISNNFSQFKPEPSKKTLRGMGLNPHFNWYVNQSYKA